MHFLFCLKALFILFLPLLAFSDPWISGKEEFKVKKLEYLSIKNQFSIDTSAYPIPLALIRNPNEDMFNNMSLMNEYIDCLLYTSPSPRDKTVSRMPSSA